MHASLVLLLLPLLAYCGVQTVRDYRRRQWPMAIWGAATTAFLVWAVEALTRGGGY